MAGYKKAIVDHLPTAVKDLSRYVQNPLTGVALVFDAVKGNSVFSLRSASTANALAHLTFHFILPHVLKKSVDYQSPRAVALLTAAGITLPNPQAYSDALGRSCEERDSCTASLLIKAGVRLLQGYAESFCQACQAGDVERVHMFVKAGIDVNTPHHLPNEDMDVPICVAALSTRPNHLEVLNLLLDAGANIHASGFGEI